MAPAHHPSPISPEVRDYLDRHGFTGVTNASVQSAGGIDYWVVDVHLDGRSFVGTAAVDREGATVVSLLAEAIGSAVELAVLCLPPPAADPAVASPHVAAPAPAGHEDTAPPAALPQGWKAAGPQETASGWFERVYANAFRQGMAASALKAWLIEHVNTPRGYTGLPDYEQLGPVGRKKIEWEILRALPPHTARG